MRQIIKSLEPREWKEYKSTPDVEYQSIEALRQSLLKEQGYICAYCMRRIPCTDRNSKESSRIEHLQSQDKYPERKLDYSNMVICCPGAINDDFHCDKSKGNQDVTFNLFSKEFISTISYRSYTGEIYSSNEHYSFEMTKVLNLNNKLLSLNRKATLDGVRKILKKKGFSKATLKNLLKEWNNKNQEGKYLEYNSIVVWFLKKKIKNGY